MSYFDLYQYLVGTLHTLLVGANQVVGTNGQTKSACMNATMFTTLLKGCGPFIVYGIMWNT